MLAARRPSRYWIVVGMLNQVFLLAQDLAGFEDFLWIVRLCEALARRAGCVMHVRRAGRGRTRVDNRGILRNVDDQNAHSFGVTRSDDSLLAAGESS